MDANTRIIDLTVGELTKLIDERIGMMAGESSVSDTYYGIRGIAKIFGCSECKAQSIKNSGKIDAAITQIGRKIIVSRSVALSEAHKNQLKI